MEIENIYRLLLIEMLSRKEKSRINFLARKQMESDDGIDDFIDHLKDAHQYWIDIYIRAHKDIIIGGGSRTIAVPNFKNTIYFGFIGELQLKLMRDEITNFINRFIKDKKESDSLAEIITHQANQYIADQVKIKYKNIRGKRLNILLKAFQDSELLPPDRIASVFHRCCKNDFNWDIASYNAMQIPKYNVHTDKDEYDSMMHFLATLKNNK